MNLLKIKNKIKSINLRKNGLILYSILIVVGLVVTQIALWGSRNTEAADIVNSAGIWCRGDDTDPIPGHIEYEKGTCYVPTNTEDLQNFDRCADSTQYGEVLICSGGFNADGSCIGEEIVQALDINDSVSCTELANQYGASIQVNVMCSDSTTGSDSNIGTVTCDPSPSTINKDTSLTSLTDEYSVDFAINVDNDSNNSISLTAGGWGECSGAAGSGASCNQYGTPPTGRMFGCYTDTTSSTGYGCFDVPINYVAPGNPGCYLDFDGQWKNCNCDISHCEASCLAAHAGNPGSYTHTEICGAYNPAGGCGQEFTCGCYIPPTTTPTDTPVITPTDTPVVTVTPTDTPTPSCPYSTVNVEFRIAGDSEWTAQNGNDWRSGSNVTSFLASHPRTNITLEANCFAYRNGTQVTVNPANFSITGPGVSNGNDGDRDGQIRGATINLQNGATYNSTCISADFPNDSSCRNTDSFTASIQPPTVTPTVTSTPTPTNTPSPTPTPIPGHITISGNVVCIDDGRTLNGATIEIYDADPNTGAGGLIGSIQANPNYFASWSPILGREHAIRLTDRGSQIPGTYVGPIATNNSVPCFVGSSYEFCTFEPSTTHTDVSFGFTDCAEPTITPSITVTPTDTPTPTVTPTVPESRLVKISGNAYCEDPNDDRYDIDGAVVYGYDSFGMPFRLITDENGYYEEFVTLEYANAEYRNEIAITLLEFDENNDQIIDATNQPYSLMVPPASANSDFALNCDDITATHCTIEAGLSGCADNSINGSSSYANCGITEADEDYYSNFDFRFNNCTPPVITPTSTPPVTPTATPVPQPGIEIVKEIINDADGVYDTGETVAFRITITNTGDITYEAIGFRDEYNQSRLDFIKVRNARTGNDITAAFRELGVIDENLGEITHGDITLISELGDLEPGEQIVLDFEFKAVRTVDSTCNDAFIEYNPGKNGYIDEDSSRACVVIKENIPVTDK